MRINYECSDDWLLIQLLWNQAEDNADGIRIADTKSWAQSKCFFFFFLSKHRIQKFKMVRVLFGMVLSQNNSRISASEYPNSNKNHQHWSGSSSQPINQSFNQATNFCCGSVPVVIEKKQLKDILPGKAGQQFCQHIVLWFSVDSLDTGQLLVSSCRYNL
jgi:hypothetical protein